MWGVSATAFFEIPQLQYWQVVQLDLGGFRWPHCGVATP
jgi:hypothetical protein